MGSERGSLGVMGLLHLLVLLGCSEMYLTGAQGSTEAVSVTEDNSDSDSDSAIMTTVLVIVGIIVGVVLIAVVAVTVFSLLRSSEKDKVDRRCRSNDTTHAHVEGVDNAMARARKYSIGDEDKWSVYKLKGHETAV